MSVIRLFFSRMFDSFDEERLGENRDAFISGVAYVNFMRIKTLSLVALFIFLLLWIWDIIQFSYGMWDDSTGYRILLCLHSFLLVFLTGVQIICRKKQPENSDSIEKHHIRFINRVLIFVLFCMVFISLGDVLKNGSVAAYLGMIFAYASIFIMTNLFALVLFGANMAVIVSLLVTVHLQTGLPMEIQIINVSSFSVVAFILSRILFFYNLKDFLNRQVINQQTEEIEQRIKEKEKLIDELKETLADVRTLSGLLPICAHCKKIRDDSGYWNQIESYIQENSKAKFSHGLCPECSDRLYGKNDWYIKMQKKKNKEKHKAEQQT